MDRQVLENGGMLEAAAVFRRPACHIVAFELQAAGTDRQLAGQQVEERGLARPVASRDDGVDFAGLNLERQVTLRGEVTSGLLDNDLVSKKLMAATSPSRPEPPQPPTGPPSRLFRTG